jgi:hypothetical protein
MTDVSIQGSVKKKNKKKTINNKRVIIIKRIVSIIIKINFYFRNKFDRKIRILVRNHKRKKYKQT